MSPIVGRFYMYDPDWTQTFMYVWSVPLGMGAMLDHFRWVWDAAE